MIISSIVAQMVLALFGGVAAELLHWYMLARKPESQKGLACMFRTGFTG